MDFKKPLTAILIALSAAGITYVASPTVEPLPVGEAKLVLQEDAREILAENIEVKDSDGNVISIDQIITILEKAYSIKDGEETNATVKHYQASILQFDIDGKTAYLNALQAEVDLEQPLVDKNDTSRIVIFYDTVTGEAKNQNIEISQEFIDQKKSAIIDIQIQIDDMQLILNSANKIN